MSNCDSSWRTSFTAAGATADIMQISIGEFISQQSEALGSLDGSETFVRVSSVPVLCPRIWLLCSYLALDLEGVHNVKLHHPSSSVATSNQ